PRPLDLELGNEDRRLARSALDIDDRTLIREKPEVREVADVVRTKEDDGAGARAARMIEQPRPTLAELARRNARREHVADPTEERRISDLHVQSSRRRATHYAGGVERAIVGYHQDEHGDWVAELACGHQRHVRHRP